jgi:hypothetical protein
MCESDHLIRPLEFDVFTLEPFQLGAFVAR